jgi:hypothetical protein
LKNKLLIGLWAILAFACTESQEIPKNILAKQKITALLIDLHWSDAKIAQSAYTNTDSAQYNYWLLEKDIFKRHKTDTATFRQSMAYYSSHPKLLEDIYNIVVDSLSYRESLAKTQTQKKTTESDKAKKAAKNPQDL